MAGNSVSQSAAAASSLAAAIASGSGSKEAPTSDDIASAISSARESGVMQASIYIDQLQQYVDSTSPAATSDTTVKQHVRDIKEQIDALCTLDAELMSCDFIQGVAREITNNIERLKVVLASVARDLWGWVCALAPHVHAAQVLHNTTKSFIKDCFVVSPVRSLMELYLDDGLCAEVVKAKGDSLARRPTKDKGRSKGDARAAESDALAVAGSTEAGLEAAESSADGSADRMAGTTPAAISSEDGGKPQVDGTWVTISGKEFRFTVYKEGRVTKTRKANMTLNQALHWTVSRPVVDRQADKMASSAGSICTNANAIPTNEKDAIAAGTAISDSPATPIAAHPVGHRSWAAIVAGKGTPAAVSASQLDFSEIAWPALGESPATEAVPVDAGTSSRGPQKRINFESASGPPATLAARIPTLANKNNTACYANSPIQAMFNTSALRQKILEAPRAVFKRDRCLDELVGLLANMNAVEKVGGSKDGILDSSSVLEEITSTYASEFPPGQHATPWPFGTNSLHTWTSTRQFVPKGHGVAC